MRTSPLGGSAGGPEATQARAPSTSRARGPPAGAPARRPGGRTDEPRRHQRGASRPAAGERVRDCGGHLGQPALDRPPVAPAARRTTHVAAPGPASATKLAGPGPTTISRAPISPRVPSTASLRRSASVGEYPSRPARIIGSTASASQRPAAGLASIASRTATAAAPPAAAARTTGTIGPARSASPPPDLASPDPAGGIDHLGDLDHPAAAVGHPRQVHDQIEAPVDLISDRVVRQADPRHQGEGLQPSQRIDWRVRVHGGQRPVVTGVQRREQVERLAAPDLADHDPVRAHPKRVSEQVTDRHLATALDARGPTLEPHDVRLAQSELGGVLDRDHPLAHSDVGRERVQKRRLPRPRATGDQDAAAVPDRRGEELAKFLGEGPRGDQLVRVGARGGEPADRDRGTVDREGRDHHVDTRPVRESRVDHRAELIDSPSQRGQDALDRVAQRALGVKSDFGRLDPAPAFHVDLLGPVDHHLLDGRVGHQLLERPEPDRVPEDQLADPGPSPLR